MTKLEKLLQELCPEGVVYKTLGEIATDVFRGAGITRDQIRETGTPCVRYGEIYTTYGVWFKDCVSHTDETLLTSKKYFDYGDILFAITGESVEDIAKCCAYIGHETCLAGGDIVVLKHNEDPKYLSYALSTLDAQKQKSKGKVKSKVVHSSVPDIKAIRVPVPPLPVQREIVRILDNFTEHITELTEQLNLELTARKKQYEFYRNQLLTFDAQGATILTDRQTDKPNDLNRLCQYVSEFIFVKLSDISVNCDSLRKPVTSGNREAGNIPYYGASGIVDYVKDYIFDGDYLLISEDGANLLARNTPIAFSISGKNWVNNHAHILRFNNRITQRYVEIYLNSIDLSPYISGGAQPKLNQQNLYKIPIPLPSYQKQKEIVTILDRFDTLCTDLSSGLPAEIEARQKQYEYYRDKLLTFGERFN